jgi:hypothetical protein
MCQPRGCGVSEIGDAQADVTNIDGHRTGDAVGGPLVLRHQTEPLNDRCVKDGDVTAGINHAANAQRGRDRLSGCQPCRRLGGVQPHEGFEAQAVCVKQER